jgi:predicted cupin superfamily sugar epimerase
MSETKVKVDLSFTRNLGNYESIKIGIGVEDIVRYQMLIPPQSVYISL